MDILKIYEYALAREHEGKRFFESNAERMSHSAAVGAFKQLAAEEQRHIYFINMQIEVVKRGMPSDASEGVEMERSGFFTQRASMASIDQTVAESMVPDLPILRMAYLIERDFAEFYEMAAQKAEGEAQRVLSMLAQWERGHERFFKEWHDKIFNDYANMPWGG